MRGPRLSSFGAPACTWLQHPVAKWPQLQADVHLRLAQSQLVFVAVREIEKEREGERKNDESTTINIVILSLPGACLRVHAGEPGRPV